MDKSGQIHQFVAHIDRVDEAQAPKIILFKRAIAVFHGKIKLQDFKPNLKKPCRSRPMKSSFFPSINNGLSLFRAKEVCGPVADGNEAPQAGRG